MRAMIVADVGAGVDREGDGRVAEVVPPERRHAWERAYTEQPSPLAGFGQRLV